MTNHWTQNAQMKRINEQSHKIITRKQQYLIMILAFILINNDSYGGLENVRSSNGSFNLSSI